MLTEQQIAQFDRNGFINGGQVLTDAEVEELRGELMALIDHGPEGFAPGEPEPVLFRDMTGGAGRPVWQIVNIWEACPAFHRLIYRREVVEAIQQLTRASELMVWHDQIQYKPAEVGGTTRWHQDAPLWPIILPNTMVTAWVALDEVDVENGAMSMVPGTHKWGDQMAYLNSLESFESVGAGFEPPDGSKIEKLEAVFCPVKKGEVHFHHSLVWHGSHDNTSGRPRRAIGMHYMTGETYYDSSGAHPMEQFVHIPDGELMLKAGKHFPHVCENGRPLPLPAELVPA